MYFGSRALILKTSDLRETDKLVTIFSEQEGKLTAVARGIKKPNSSLRACVQPFCHSQLFFSRGRELDLITQGKLLEFYGNAREDLNRTLHCMYIMELLDKSLMDRVPLPRLYKTTLETLQTINQSEINPLVIRYFEMNLLIYLGYKPVLDQCISCQRSDVQLNRFNLAEGGMVCPSCIKNSSDEINVSGETLALLKRIGRVPTNTLERIRASNMALNQMEIFLEKNLEYHLERKFNLKYTIRRLKSSV
ncbi:MAG: DNA repair protein RecO [Syntrophomonadaceae bacterium]|nr:DNA repair protein RecO [Syntrophomonadaceae bacterium]